MVRLKDIPALDAKHLREKECPVFDNEPFILGPALEDRRVAIVTTAGLHRRKDKNFLLQDTGYRVAGYGVPGYGGAGYRILVARFRVLQPSSEHLQDSGAKPPRKL